MTTIDNAGVVRALNAAGVLAAVDGEGVSIYPDSERKVIWITGYAGWDYATVYVYDEEYESYTDTADSVDLPVQIEDDADTAVFAVLWYQRVQEYRLAATLGE